MTLLGQNTVAKRFSWINCPLPRAAKRLKQLDCFVNAAAVKRQG
jgi:hypothetical protein